MRAEPFPDVSQYRFECIANSRTSTAQYLQRDPGKHDSDRLTRPGESGWETKETYLPGLRVAVELLDSPHWANLTLGL